MIRLLGVVLFLVCIGTISGMVALDQAYSGRILPNVAIRGLDVSQMQPDEARTVLERRYAAFLATPVTFEFAGRTWQPTPAQLGVSLELDDAINRAYALGRGADLPLSLLEVLALWQNGFEVPLRLSVDQQQLQAYLLDVARQIDTPPQDATLGISAGQVRNASAQSGRQLLVDATIQDVLSNLQTLQSQTVTLRTRLLRPTLEDSGIAEARQQLDALLQSPLTLTYGERQWTWTPEQLGMLVQFSRAPRADEPGDYVTVALDQQLLEYWLGQLAEEIDTSPVEPRLRFTANGLDFITEGRTGAHLEVEQAREQLLPALWQDQRTLELPITVLQPRARPDTLASLGIVEMVAQGKSSFLNSEPYRITNIQAGTRRMDGVLIAPGEEFSFNRTIGSINAANGFTQGYAIINGRTELEWGGGVCQVSTTVFRAAFWAGVPITERNQHTYRIRWYEKFEPIGMDAAIFTGPGGYDMRFINDTGHWLLMEAYADVANEVLTINLYGTRPGWQVAQTPPQVDNVRGGLDVRVGRVVTDQSGAVLAEETFYSYFKPWPNS